MKIKSRNPSSLLNVYILIEHSIHSYLWKLKLKFADYIPTQDWELRLKTPKAGEGIEGFES